MWKPFLKKSTMSVEKSVPAKTGVFIIPSGNKTFQSDTKVHFQDKTYTTGETPQYFPIRFNFFVSKLKS